MGDADREATILRRLSTSRVLGNSLFGRLTVFSCNKNGLRWCCKCWRRSCACRILWFQSLFHTQKDVCWLCAWYALATLVRAPDHSKIPVLQEREDPVRILQRRWVPWIRTQSCIAMQFGHIWQDWRQSCNTHLVISRAVALQCFLLATCPIADFTHCGTSAWKQLAKSFTAYAWRVIKSRSSK